MAEDVKLKLIIDTANSAKTVADVRKSLKDLRTAALQVEQGSEAFFELTKAAGELQDRLNPINEQLKFFADGERNITGFASTVNTLANSFSLAQSATALLGTESEDLQKVILKVQSAMAIANATQALANELKSTGTTRLFLQTAAQNAWNSSLVQSIRGLKGVQAALVATGIGAAAVALGLLISYWDEFVGYLKEGKKRFDELGTPIKVIISLLFPLIGVINLTMEAIEMFGSETDKTKKSTADLTSELELQVKVLEAQNASFEKIFKVKREILKLQGAEIELNIRAEKDEKKKAELQRELNKVLGDYLGLLKQKKEEQKKDAEEEKKISDDLEKKRKEAAENQKKLIQQLIDERNKAIKDEQEREIATLTEATKRRLEEIKGNGVVERELRKQIEENLGTEIAAIRKKYADIEEKRRKEAIEKEQEEAKLKREREKAEEEKINSELLLLAQNNTAAFLLEQKRQGSLSQEAVIANGEKLKELRTVEFEKELENDNLTSEQKRAARIKFQEDILAIDNDTAAKRQAIRDAELAAASELVGALGALANQLGNQSAEAIAFQKAVALAEIGISLAKAIGSLTAASAGNPLNGPTGGAAGAVQYATGLVQILASIAQARNILSEQANPPAPPQFATGGFVSGAGTATSDSIPAWLSNGEFVVNAKSTSVFAPLLDAMNNMTLDSSFMQARNGGNGVSQNNVSPIESKQTIEVKAYVSEKEITDSQKRITKIERNGTIY